MARLQSAEHSDHPGDFDWAGDLANAFIKPGESHKTEGYTKLGAIVNPAGEHGLPSSGARAHPALRDLQQDAESLCVALDLTLPGCDAVTLPAQTVTVWFLPPGSTTDTLTGWLGVVNIESVVFEAGKATATFDEDNIYDSAGAKADYCEDCVVLAVGSNQDCADGEMTTSNVQVRTRRTIELCFRRGVNDERAA
ncbi:MAG: hypothetical protein ABJX82_10450 [Paracoccaceae bacterium]